MKKNIIRSLFVCGAFIFLSGAGITEPQVSLLEMLKTQHRCTEAQLSSVKAIFAKSAVLGQGNPKATQHPMTREECLAIRQTNNVPLANPAYETICKAPYMAPLYDPSRETAQQARVCVDQYEFPDIPCEYPVVWVKASEASELCKAIGKRLCDAHEWEGACAGSLQPPDYHFELLKPGMTESQMHAALRKAHNHGRKILWSYGSKQDHSLCATKSRKSDGCDEANRTGVGVWAKCGSNTYPAGAFPQCKSSFDVYDIHGNAAEHMNLPFKQSEMTKNGGIGYTEMKGSWFVFSKISAHEDDCRWRAPYWHGTAIMSPHSHSNYHLGFRCCKDVQ